MVLLIFHPLLLLIDPLSIPNNPSITILESVSNCYCTVLLLLTALLSITFVEFTSAFPCCESSCCYSIHSHWKMICCSAAIPSFVAVNCELIHYCQFVSTFSCCSCCCCSCFNCGRDFCCLKVNLWLNLFLIAVAALFLVTALSWVPWFSLPLSLVAHIFMQLLHPSSIGICMLSSWYSTLYCC